jgi:hypothetical protein
LLINGIIFCTFLFIGINRYEFAIAILSTVYTGGKSLRQVLELWTGKRWFQQRTSALLDFFGVAFLAFFALAFSAIVSGYKLSTQSDI